MDIALTTSTNLTLNDQAIVYLSGNRCGHDPLNPRWYAPPAAHGRRPDVLYNASQKTALFYRYPKQHLLSLRLTRQSSRQERSEAREMDAGVLQVSLHYLDLASLRVGVPGKGTQFKSLGYREMAEHLGYRDKNDPTDKGIKRVSRAMARFVRAGYITVYQRVEKDADGEYRGLNAVKRIHPMLLYELGVSRLKLDKARKYARKRLNQQATLVQTQQRSSLQHLVKQMVGKSVPSALKENKQARLQRAEQKKIANREKMRQRHGEAWIAASDELARLHRLPENIPLSLKALKAQYPHLARQLE